MSSRLSLSGGVKAFPVAEMLFKDWPEGKPRIVGYSGKCVFVETSSRKDYKPAREFYRKCGYQETARVRDFFASGDDKVIFSKRLT